MIEENIKKIFINFIKEEKLIETGDKILIMLSGGPDSIALLYLLNSIQKFFNLTLYTYHLNHLIRKESYLDAKISKQASYKYNIPFYYIKFNVKLYAKKHKFSLEQAARKIRYHFAYRLSNKLKCNKIATGHNLDDNIETFFLNLFRGSGLSGLKGIEIKKDKIIRPLLTIKKQNLKKLCDKLNLKYAIDKTNKDIKYKRNYIRKKIIPIFEKEIPNFKEKMQKTIYLLYLDNSYLNNLTLQNLKSLIYVKNKDFIHLQINNNYKNLDKSLQLKIIKKLLTIFNIKQYSFENITTLYNLILNNNNFKYQIDKIEIEKSRNNLFIYKLNIKNNEKDYVYIINDIINKEIKNKEFNLYISKKQVNDLKNYIPIKVQINKKDKIIIRKRKKGDKISKKTKLKTFLIKNKIPQILKYFLYIIEINNKIIAIPPIFKKENNKENLIIYFKYNNILSNYINLNFNK